MLLPHGFEGMGPEHSSARLERFLALAAEDNIQVVYPTTPAQYFHVLRRQVLRPWRKPLVVMSPKSLLRHLEAVSPLEDFSSGTWQPILADVGERDAKSVDRVLLCAGKIYYELDKEREARGANDVAILRLEQLYPFDESRLEKATGAIPCRSRNRVGSGRAGKYGCVASYEADVRARNVRQKISRRLSSGFGKPGHRLIEQSQKRAGTRARTSVWRQG